jgi:CTP:phosphocholine cytidylyltransferase-like protein
MNCVILADKIVKGIKSKGWVGSLPVNSQSSLIDHQLKVIEKQFPRCKIFYVYGFDSKRVENYLHKIHNDVTFVNNEEYNKYGQIYSIYKVIDLIQKECFFLNGDLVLQPSMFKNFNKRYSQIFVNNKSSSELGASIDDNNNVQHISYGLDNLVTNMFFINEKSIDNFKKNVENWNYRNYFCFEIINKMIEQGNNFKAHQINRSNLFLSINE